MRNRLVTGLLILCAASLDDLLSAPNSFHSTPVDRCLEPGATGYRFKRK